MSRKKTGKQKEPMRFFAQNFWDLMEKQGGRCALSGRELTPDTTEVELKEPYKKEGRTDFPNHYLVTRPLSFMARYLSESEIVEICIEVVRHRGKEKGFALREVRRSRK